MYHYDERTSEGIFFENELKKRNIDTYKAADILQMTEGRLQSLIHGKAYFSMYMAKDFLRKIDEQLFHEYMCRKHKREHFDKKNRFNGSENPFYTAFYGK